MKKIALLAICSLSTGVCLAQGGSERANRFAEMDTDADGSVTRAEFIASRGVTFEKRDRNSDGYLDKADMGKRAARRGSERIEQMLEQLDMNEDGRVSRDEFMSADSPLFTRADQDSNGILDAAEIEKAKAAMQSKMRDRRG